MGKGALGAKNTGHREDKTRINVLRGKKREKKYKKYENNKTLLFRAQIKINPRAQCFMPLDNKLLKLNKIH